MKNFKLLLLISLLSFSAAPSIAQCNSAEIVNLCIPNLPSDYMFLKGYEVNRKGGQLEKVEYSYPFAKGTDYMINLCPQAGVEGLVVTLYNHKRMELATNVIDGQFATAIVFSCQTTGLYYITYTSVKPNPYCGGCVIGLKKQNL